MRGLVPAYTRGALPGTDEAGRNEIREREEEEWVGRT